MLWSVIKVTIFVALAGLVAWGSSYVLDTPGEVRIAFDGREFSFDPLGFLIALVVGFFAVWLIFKLAGLLVAILRVFTGEETALRRYLDRNYERRGYEALQGGMIALAAGEGREAMRKAAKAERLLDRPELTMLLSAQAAEMNGDRDKAESYFKLLLENETTRFVALRGLMHRKLQEGRKDLALKLAEKAFELSPRSEDVQDTLFALQTETGDWAGARKTLEAKVRARSLPRDVGARRDAVLLLSEAREAEVSGDIARARTAAYEANRMVPDLVPAAVTSARLKAGEGDKRTAEKILRRAWEGSPHPDLAAGFAALEPQELPAERQRRFKTVVALKPEHPETRLLAAELALAAEDFPGARRALGDLAETRPTTRTLALMAAAVRGEGAAEAVVRGWLARAIVAPRGEQWTCGKCRHVHAAWTPVCESCNAFDTLAWEQPPAPTGQDATAAAMLPLIVGNTGPGDQVVPGAAA